MPSVTTFIVVAILVYVFTYAISKVATSTKEFKRQTAEDQVRARKHLRLTLIILPILLAGTYLFLLAPPQVSRLLPVLLYFSLWALVVWLLWRSYRLGVKRDIRLVKGMSGKPLRNPETLLRSFALANLLVSLGILAILLTIPLLRLPLNLWAPLLTIVTSLYTLFAWRMERKNAA